MAESAQSRAFLAQSDFLAFSLKNKGLRGLACTQIGPDSPRNFNRDKAGIKFA
jgi:hypothetical protein